MMMMAGGEERMLMKMLEWEVDGGDGVLIVLHQRAWILKEYIVVRESRGNFAFVQDSYDPRAP